VVGWTSIINVAGFNKNDLVMMLMVLMMLLKFLLMQMLLNCWWNEEIFSFFLEGAVLKYEDFW